MERRVKNRDRTLKRARIVFPGGYSTIDCVVFDISETGARLQHGQHQPLPVSFELRILDGPTCRVELCYQSVDTTGVRFLDKPGYQAPAVAAIPPTAIATP
jgi:hypothetical protein